MSGFDEKGVQMMTISNILSLLRASLAPLMWWLLQHHYNREAVILGILAMITDMLDGYLAREMDEITELGKIIDPIADKAFVAVTAIALVMRGSLPLWFVVAVIARDLIILGAAFYAQTKLPKIMPSNKIGKATVIVISIVLLLGILEAHFLLDFFITLATLMMLLSLGVYGQRMQKELQKTEARQSLSHTKEKSQPPTKQSPDEKNSEASNDINNVLYQLQQQELRKIPLREGLRQLREEIIMLCEQFNIFILYDRVIERKICLSPTEAQRKNQQDALKAIVNTLEQFDQQLWSQQFSNEQVTWAEIDQDLSNLYECLHFYDGLKDILEEIKEDILNGKENGLFDEPFMLTYEKELNTRHKKSE